MDDLPDGSPLWSAGLFIIEEIQGLDDSAGLAAVGNEP